MNKPESHVVYSILKAWGAHPQLRIWRNNTGVGYFNDKGPCRRTDPGARPVHYGFRGQGDISGVLAYWIDVAGVRRLFGLRFEVECKTYRPGSEQSDAQKTFQRVITGLGGVYVLARSVEDVDRVLLGYGVKR